MKYLAQALILVLVINCLLFTTGCPKKDVIRNAVDASYRLPAMTNDMISQVDDAYVKGFIDLDTVHKIGAATNKLAKAEKIFVDMVAAANKVYIQTGSYSAADISNIKIYFDSQLIAPFLDVLETLKLISGNTSALILTAIDAVRVLLQTIGKGLDSSAAKALPAATVVVVISVERKAVMA
jgi:hypothetical protein